MWRHPVLLKKISFATYEDLEKALSNYQQQTRTVFVKVDRKTVEAGNNKVIKDPANYFVRVCDIEYAWVDVLRT